MKNSICMNCDTRFNILKILNLGGRYSGQYYPSLLESFNEYPNGMISYAEDNACNGIFYMQVKFIHAFSVFEDLSIWRLSLNMRLDWPKYGARDEYPSRHVEYFSESNYDLGNYTDGFIKKYLAQKPFRNL